MQRKEVEAVLFFSFALFFLIITITYFFYYQVNAHECYCKTNSTIISTVTPNACEIICDRLGAEVVDKNYTEWFNNEVSGLLWD